MGVNEKELHKKKRNGASPDARSIGVVFPLQFLRDLGDAIRWLRPQRAIIFGSAVRTGLGAREI